jgi:sulfoxide reductase heme-binding subunit YedZ
VGFAVFLILLSLALTSTNGWIRRLGKRWTRLHALIYVAALGAVIHFLWQVKADVREPTIFGVLIAGLLAYRLVPRRIRRPAPAARRPQAAGTPVPGAS